jgi:ribosomal protein S18 acetylase RimI-like enzyme
MPVTIRDARPSELDQVGELRVRAYVSGGHMSPDSGYAPKLRALGAAGDGDILVAKADGQVIGTVMLQYPPQAGHVVQAPDEAEVRALAVAPDWQGRGIGRALIHAAIARAAQRRVRHLVLCTQQDMAAAHRIYEQAGFARLEDRDWAPEPGVTLLAYGLALGAG